MKLRRHIIGAFASSSASWLGYQFLWTLINQFLWWILFLYFRLCFGKKQVSIGNRLNFHLIIICNIFFTLSERCALRLNFDYFLKWNLRFRRIYISIWVELFFIRILGQQLLRLVWSKPIWILNYFLLFIVRLTKTGLFCLVDLTLVL